MVTHAASQSTTHTSHPASGPASSPEPSPEPSHHHDHAQMKLGRAAAKKDPRTLKLGKYMTRDMSQPPSTADWTKGIATWGMMLNDVHSNCTIAAAGHAVQVWSAHTSTESTVPDPLILKYYEEWAGYNPSNPATDTGGAALNVLTAWRKSAFDTHKLFAYADAAFDDLEQIRHAISLFGGVYIGLSLPTTAKTQLLWDVVPTAGDDAKPGSWGGHAVFVPKYDAIGFTCVSWGRLFPMTIAFWRQYVEEAHALLGHDWLQQKGSPVGFDLDQLKADLALIHTQKQGPEVSLGN